jgi:hypothetical protein
MKSCGNVCLSTAMLVLDHASLRKIVIYNIIFVSGAVKMCPHGTMPNAHTSVADPGCLSRIPDPDFYPSRIPDL